MKRATLIIGCLFIIAIIFASQLRPPEFDKRECIIGTEKVTINSFIKGKLVESVSLKNSTIVKWKTGMKVPYKTAYKQIVKDRGPTTRDGKIPLKIYADGQIIFWGINVTKECYEAI